MTSIIKVNNIQNSSGTSAMTINSGGVVLTPNRPCFHVEKNADQSISDASIEVVTFETTTDGANSGQVINKGGLFASNKFTVTATTTGIYYFYTYLFCQSSSTSSDTYIYLRKNGSTQLQTVYPMYVNGTASYTLHTGQLVNLSSSGDYVEVVVDCDQNNGSALNVNWTSGYQRTNFGGYLIG